MSMMADQFCLRWNNFQSNIVSALDSLKCSEDLVDVTLTCEGRNIKAHKVILSACSPYFRNVFKENPCQHPVIILKDVLAEDIVNLLSYMYQGEVFIEESKLSSFLHTAALLQVKGLTGVTQQNRDNFVSTAVAPLTTNKLYTQLTISPKSNSQHQQKEQTQRPPATTKKRRNSASDKPSDINCVDLKRTKPVEKHTEQKLDTEQPQDQDKCTQNGKSQTDNQVGNASDEASASGRVTVKVERPEDDEAAPDDDDDNDNDNGDTDKETETAPDYENSMLARSLLSGINPSKSDINANNASPKSKMPIKIDMPPNRNATQLFSKQSPAEDQVKSEKSSPSPDGYEPEVLLSEQSDGADYPQETSQALLLLAGMSNISVLSQGASTSQGSSHQSNHAAICGDCPHCGMKYSNQSALKYHVRLMHSDLTNRLCCYLCPRSFTMRETFKEHMWTTHGQRN